MSPAEPRTRRKPMSTKEQSQPTNPTPMTQRSGEDERVAAVAATPTCEKGQPKKVRLKIGNWEDDVDVEIAPLIREIWKAGIYAQGSGLYDGDESIEVEFLSEECM